MLRHWKKSVPKLPSGPKKGSSEARFQPKGRHVAYARLKEQPALYGRQLATMTSHPILARRQAEPKQYRKRHRDITRTQWPYMNYTIGIGAAVHKNDGMPIPASKILALKNISYASPVLACEGKVH